MSNNALQRNPKIGVYVICKNEIKFIERCFHSLKEADAIVICDTGSSDGTFEAAASLVKLQSLNKLYTGTMIERPGTVMFKDEFNSMLVQKIYVNPWRFDDAKNSALYMLPANVDVAVSLDADELLEPGWYEKLSNAIQKDLNDTGQIADRYHHRFKTIWDWDGAGNSISEHWHERIHARHGYMWKLPVHEHLIKCDGTPENVKWIPDLLMIQKPDTSKSRSSYLPLLEQSAKEDKKRWKTFSFLAGEYINANRLDDAINAIEHALSLSDSDKAYLNYQLSGVHQRKGDFDSAIFDMMNAGKAAPDVREYVVYLAQVYIAAGRRTDALLAYERAAKITQRTYGYEYNPSCWGESFDSILNTLRGER